MSNKKICYLNIEKIGNNFKIGPNQIEEIMLTMILLKWIVYKFQTSSQEEIM
jgi:hypothetical protein